nr:helix-turn-helix domain-containing protein [Legionella cincinnatiensis]
MFMKDDEILVIKELAEYLKINEKTAYRFAAEGKIPGFKIGGAWRFRRDEIEKLTKGQFMAAPKGEIVDE